MDSVCRSSKNCILLVDGDPNKPVRVSVLNTHDDGIRASLTLNNSDPIWVSPSVEGALAIIKRKARVSWYGSTYQEPHISEGLEGQSLQVGIITSVTTITQVLEPELDSLKDKLV